MTHEKHVAERYSICYNTNEGTTRNGVGGQPSQEGFATLLAFARGVLPMTVLEVLALLGFGLASFKIGYIIGNNAKK